MSVERLAPAVRALLRDEIAAAHGREVSFVARPDASGRIEDARVVARGTVDAVLALPGIARRGELLLHNHPSGVLEPSGADLAVAAQLHDGGVGFAIVDNAVSDCYVVVEAPRPRATTRIDPIDAALLLAPSGPVARAFGSFEDRRSQRDMTAYIADLYNDGGVGLLEAGTGVGKSFAYLVPALVWARENDDRTVVSTNTINLQEQLVGKDLPILARALGTGSHSPSFALLKGWRNYICLARLGQAREQAPSLFADDQQDELEALAAWAAHSSDGSLADLPDEPSGDVWDAVAAESDLCTRLQCPHFERCFLFQARRRAAEADIVVVNHHLLASDLAVRLASDNWQEAAVLPPYQRLVLDEAHHFEDVAAMHLGAHVSRLGVERLLGRLEKNGRGLLPTLRAVLFGRDDLLGAGGRDAVQGGLTDALATARRAAETVFGLLAARLDQEPGPSPVVRLTSAVVEDAAWPEGLAVALENLLVSFSRLAEGTALVAERLTLDSSAERHASLVQELRGVARRLDHAASGLSAALRPPADDTTAVRWLERRGGGAGAAGPAAPAAGGRGARRPGNVSLAAVPLDLAPILKTSLFDRVETVVLTSATLAAGGEFGYLEERLGLDLPPSRVKVREVHASPFDFATQCVFGIPTDLPEPRDDAPGHDRAVARVIVELVHASDGGMFALFTSHGALRRTADVVRAEIGARWPLFVQGEGQRDQLLRRFRDAGNAILLGTNSFWEGVDVPGHALRVLVLAKLPFKVPTEPLTAARLERLEARGLNGFAHYLVPNAALKLKQGFGRLIRSRADQGAVVLLDRRVITRPYGAALLEGLPPATRVVGPWAAVREACDQFFGRSSGTPRGTTTGAGTGRETGIGTGLPLAARAAGGEQG